MNLKTKSAAVALATAALLAGCSKNETDASSEGLDLTAQALAAAEASGYRPPDGGTVELHIYTWCDYIAPDVIASFEQALKCKVVVDTFDSNEAMYAKLKAGGTGYDLITPSSYQVATMAREGMIDAIDHAKCPNVKKNFDTDYANQIIDPTFKYNVPYAVTYTGFAYDKKRIPEGADVNSWRILANPALKGRVSLLDDIREVIGAGLMVNGYSVNSTDAKEIEAAVKTVLAWRANIRKFDGESYKTEVPGGSTWLGHGYSTDVTQVIVGDEDAGSPARDDIGFALPKEGSRSRSTNSWSPSPPRRRPSPMRSSTTSTTATSRRRTWTTSAVRIRSSPASKNSMTTTASSSPSRPSSSSRDRFS